MNCQQAIDHALPSGSPTFDIFNVPLLEIQFSQLQGSAGRQFALTTPLHAVCGVSHYHCDILLVTGDRPVYPACRRLIRHPQPVPVNAPLWMDKYQVHEWYPFSGKRAYRHPNPHCSGRRDVTCSGAGLASAAFPNFKAADIGAYSTVRYLGVLDNTVNTLRDENIWYHGSIWMKPGTTLDARLRFQLRGNVTLGFSSTGEQSAAGNPPLSIA